MSQRTVATRYASALAEEAQQDNILTTIDEDVTLLRTTLDENDEFARFFTNPVLSSDQKERVVTALLQDHVNELTLRFLQLLARKKRVALIKQILAAYRSIRDDQEGIVEAHVRTSHEMTEEEEELVIDALERMTKSSIRLEKTLDPSLIGGLVIQIGDRVYDGSVHHKLEALRNRFHSNTHLATATN